MTELHEKFQDALREPRLIIELDRNLIGGAPLVRLLKPGATERSKRPKLCPTIVGDEDETHASMLRTLADAMEQANR